MSMSGRMSTDRGPGTVWNYGPVPTYAAADGSSSAQHQSHGRRSSIYRAQNSTLFSAFEDDEREEEGVAMEDLESDEDSPRRQGDGRRADGDVPLSQQTGLAEGRSLVGKKIGAGVGR